MITVCTSATDTQLAALGDLMTMLGATASSSGMDLSLTQASDWAERYVGYPLRRQVYEETVASYGTQRLVRPLRGVGPIGSAALIGVPASGGTDNFTR